MLFVSCAMCLHASEPGTSQPPGLIDSCRYTDDAAAQAAWRPMEGTAPVSMVTSDGCPALRMPCNFSGTKIVRASWDRHGEIDLSECSGIRFEMRCPNIFPVSDFHIYFESGAGWYTTSFSLESTTAWNTIIIDKSNTQIEGKPAGWDKVRTIRISAWCGGGIDTELLLSNIICVGVLGGDATVAILRADSVATAQPGELGSVTSFAESMGKMLRAQGIAYAMLSDLDATRECLAKARLVILPYNPAIPDAALDSLTTFLEHGGKLMTFYGLHPRLVPLVHIETGNYIAQKAAGQFAALKFEAGALPGAPPVVGQRSWNIIETLPVPGASRVLAEWIDAQDKPSGHAAMVGSSNCIAMSHVLLTDNGVNKQRLLLAMVGQLVPAVWQQAAAAGIAQIGRIRGFSGFDDAVATIPRLTRGNRPGVADAIHTAKQLRGQAQKLATQGHHAEARDVSGEAARRLLDAYCQAQGPMAGDEFRAFWCHDAYGVEGMTWDAVIKQLADNRFTAVFPNMLWGGSASYFSKVLPQSPTLAQHGDAIAECVAACRKYKIQCHVWKVCWNLGGSAPEDFVLRMRAEGRLQMSSDGAESLWLCPSHPANQKLEIDAMVEVARNYDVDGLHFDYIRYQGLEHCFCAGCRQRFELARGSALTLWPNDVLPGGSARAEWLEWRRSHITAVVKAVREQVHTFKPQVKISAAVFGNWSDARDSVAQDWKLWCERGYLDFVCPMDYTPSNAYFTNLLRNQQWLTGHVPFYPGIGASATNPALGTDGVIEQILSTRSEGTGGFIIFNLNQSVMRELLPHLGQGISAAK